MVAQPRGPVHHGPQRGCELNLTHPIVVLGTPRSGSSLTAGLISLHGVWTGECREADERNPKGYFENEELKKLRLDGRVCPAEVKIVLKRQGWNGERWMVKHGAGGFEAWLQFFPQYVLCRRDPQKSFDSWMKHNPRTPARHHRAKIRRDTNIMNHVREKYDGIDFHPDELRKGWDPLKELFAKLGLEPDLRICRNFYDPSLWNTV